MIIICEFCGSENNVPDLYEPSKTYRCGKCNFLLWWQPPDRTNMEYWAKYTKNGEVDWTQFNDEQLKEIPIRAKSYQEDLKELSDDELILFNSKLMAESLSSYPVVKGSSDPALQLAVVNEVHRRSVAAGWFWRRWRKPSEYTKWVHHRQKMEEMTYQHAMEVVSSGERASGASLDNHDVTGVDK